MEVKLQVGQVLYVKGNRYNFDAIHAVVDKIGRRYVYFKPTWVYKVDLKAIEENIADGYRSDSHSFYLSKKEYERITAFHSVWEEFRSKAQRLWRMPSGITEEDIRAAAKLLNIELPSEDK